MSDKILLTGISGWIAKHIAIDLLKSGYEVLGTVRNDNLIEETKKTLASKEAPLGKLSFVKLDLIKDDGWNEAEMENQRRRFEKERQEAFEFGGFNFAKEALSLLDNLDRAITSFKNDEKLKNNKDLDKIIEGIEIVKKDLISIFNKNGIESIKCLDKKFDPNFHQAMLEIEDDKKDAGIVTQEIQKGYMMKDRLLRPSLVGVTKKREETEKKEPNIEKKDEK